MYEKREKRWGSETVIFYGPYLVKRLVIDGTTSMHYHNGKTETIIVESGVLGVEVEDGTHYLNPGETLTLYEQQRHRMFGSATYIECSTPQLYDSVRSEQCPHCQTIVESKTLLFTCSCGITFKREGNVLR